MPESTRIINIYHKIYMLHIVKLNRLNKRKEYSLNAQEALDMGYSTRFES